MIKELTLDYGPNYNNYGIIGKSEKINKVIEIAKVVAPTEISVLITGESGSGKEVISDLIHRLSNRKSKKFIAINCGAIPEGLIENELFGHEKGSYTSAGDLKKGYFENADQGTIFLDEIGELPLASQVKLLRVLETSSFMRVGGSKSISVDVRIIAATNKNLREMVEKGSFREDLYFRLKAVTLELPSLRERLEDIPLFVHKFSEILSKKHNRPVISFEVEALNAIMGYHWKGNVRELKNFIDMLCVMEAGKIINEGTIKKYLPTETEAKTSHLPVLLETKPENEREIIFRTLLEIKNDLNLIKEFLTKQAVATPIRPVSPEYDEEGIIDLEIPHHISEKEEIEYSLRKYNGNRRKAAKELGISERTLYRKIDKYDIKI